MSLLKRLKNLWKLSAFEPIDLMLGHSTYTTEESMKPLTAAQVEKNVQQLATIIDMRKPLDNFPDYDETN